MAIVYKVTNLINDKAYIGITTRTLKERKKDHLKKVKQNSNLLLHKAIRKYHINNFKWEILEECYEKVMEDREIYYIKYYNTYAPNKKGYNLTKGGLYVYGSKGEFYWLNRLTDEERKDWLNKNRKGENNGMYGNGKLLAGDNHFLNKMTKEERDKWLEYNLRGDNNYQKHMTKEELSKKCWLNNVSNETKQEYINKHLKGENSPSFKHAKLYVITLPNGKEYISKISTFCKTYTDVKLYETGLRSVSTGRWKHYKQFKCRKYNENIDIGIEYWNKNGD